MKKMNLFKKAVIILTAAAILVASAVPMNVQAKASTSKKVVSVTPTIKSAKCHRNGIKVTFTVPVKIAKKLKKAEIVTVAYGSKKLPYKSEVVAIKKGKNRFSFSLYTYDMVF